MTISRTLAILLLATTNSGSQAASILYVLEEGSTISTFGPGGPEALSGYSTREDIRADDISVVFSMLVPEFRSASVTLSLYTDAPGRLAPILFFDNGRCLADSCPTWFGTTVRTKGLGTSNPVLSLSG